MKRSLKDCAHYLLRKCLRSRLERDRLRMLFVVGHMRSGSTLLTHILVNHQQILGFGESHNPYQDKRQLEDAAYDIIRRCRVWWPREKYILDKVLHARLDPPLELLDWIGTRTILLIRRPEEALPSILSLNLERCSSEEEALGHYRARVRWMGKIAAGLPPRRRAVVRYNSILDRPTEILDRLARFLELDGVLSEEYELLWSTGVKGLGDTKGHIRAGRIVRDERQYENSISQEVMDAARQEFETFLESVRSAGGYALE